MIGINAGKITFTPIDDFPLLMQDDAQRPKQQWWLKLRPLARLLAEPRDPVAEKH